MSEYTSNDQWRSFQTFIAAYLAGMVHSRDVFTISRKSAVAPPLAEFRCDAAGRLWFGMGALAWSDEDGETIGIAREKVNKVAAQTVQVLREVAHLGDPSELRLSGSGPASSVSVLARAGFMTGDAEPTRQAVLQARMSADIDVEGDAIDAAAREVGQRAFAGTHSGSTASIAFAAALAGLRSWVDPFSPTPKTGFLAGGRSAAEAEQDGKARTGSPQCDSD
ncbi:hypothetical protein KIH27_17905 [Mycobacterium sp. M1]|uniref:Uncharacterized protein n=1 Tax=Mycolicibacter acidiphilus TaxID=2835306 RepID=A0ABS5RPI0_9MYCO|nr:hypothetical protein [Mycolicibacter acidiphilus]MBS9535463.1 hypothetical protein [Mycolicibacter acidiphilus]